jgi:hypothetical protein
MGCCMKGAQIGAVFQTLDQSKESMNEMRIKQGLHPHFHASFIHTTGDPPKELICRNIFRRFHSSRGRHPLDTIPPISRRRPHARRPTQYGQRPRPRQSTASSAVCGRSGAFPGPTGRPCVRTNPAPRGRAVDDRRGHVTEWFDAGAAAAAAPTGGQPRRRASRGRPKVPLLVSVAQALSDQGPWRAAHDGLVNRAARSANPSVPTFSNRLRKPGTARAPGPATPSSSRKRASPTDCAARPKSTQASTCMSSTNLSAHPIRSRARKTTFSRRSV